MGAIEKLKHAFAVDPPGPAEPTPAQQAPVDRICREIARRRLTLPGLVAMELARPLNFLVAQGMHVFSPAVWAIARRESHENYRHFAAFLERRGSIDYFIARVEHFEAAFDRRERKTKEQGKTAGADAPGPRSVEDRGPRAEEDHDQD